VSIEEHSRITYRNIWPYGKETVHVHFSRGEQYFVASHNGREILIFPANKQGEITEWTEVTDLWTIEAGSYLFDLY